MLPLVIGSCGSMIMTIEEESGAKVTFVKDKRTENYKAREQERNMEHISETESETSKEIERVEKAELNKEADETNEHEEEENIETKHNGVDTGESSKEKRCIEGEHGSLLGKGNASQSLCVAGGRYIRLKNYLWHTTKLSFTATGIE